MIRTTDEPTLDWYGAGYDAFLDAPEREEPRAGWSLLRAGISRARRGDFSLVGTVARTIIARTMDPRLHQVAAEFVADAGDAADLEVLVLTLATIDRERGLDIAHALTARGRLVDVPAVFRFYEVHREHPDCDSIPARLRWLLGSSEDTDDDPSEHTWTEYRAAAARRYFDLWSRLGTNLIHVRRGRAYDLRTLVHDILGDLRDGFLDGDDRRAFEVTTGRSCSAWFTDGQASFLTVAADLEDFLASGVVGPPPGQRAFMGHPLENADAAAGVLAAYPQNRGMGAPRAGSPSTRFSPSIPRCGTCCSPGAFARSAC